MTRTKRICAAAAVASAVATLLSISGRTGSLYPDMQKLRASSVDLAINAISTSIAEHPAEMIPP